MSTSAQKRVEMLICYSQELLLPNSGPLLLEVRSLDQSSASPGNLLEKLLLGPLPRSPESPGGFGARSSLRTNAPFHPGRLMREPLNARCRVEAPSGFLISAVSSIPPHEQICPQEQSH